MTDQPLGSAASPRSPAAWVRSAPPVLWLCAALAVAMLALQPPANYAAAAEQVLLATTLLAFLAIGQLFVVVTGGIDLSMPAVVSLASLVAATLSKQLELGVAAGAVVCLLAGVGAGALVGLCHGLVITLLRAPPFLVTLASLISVEGIAVWLTGGGRLAAEEEAIAIWYARLGPLPVPLLYLAALLVISQVTLGRSYWGRCLYAVGQNAATARVCGVPIRRTTACAYVVSGALAGFAGVLYGARLYSGSPSLVELDTLLDAIAAVVIGGASLLGGRGSASGVALGALFIALLGQSLNVLGLRIWHELVVKGLLILAAAMLDTWAIRRRR
ncbi:ABC transporter permease [Botrimarina sp.]|uniref:ABC transporter permease n=1 Tax=Botrimarina sp. TaxID=2795802 RepID=UPI0032EBFBC6